MSFNNRILWIIILFPLFIFGQTQDPVLFTVAGAPVHVSEFEYIYNKNNGKDADYSKKSLDEYLNLYTKFKLKVQAARDMKLDTIPALIKELEGYRQQLTTNYLNDKEVSDRLAREVYERQKKDISISHILVNMSPNASPADTLFAYNKIMASYNSIKGGAKFEDVAKQASGDGTSASKGGFLGWFTAMMPEGFYQLENSAYGLKKGEISMPIRTRLGYHIIKVNDIRPARRKMEVAHILIKKAAKGKPDDNAKAKVDSIYALIKAGSSFEEMARLYSQDKTTALTGGNIGYFSINQFESSFEDAAHLLNQDGDISRPVETAIGWHIIKRLHKEDELPYDRAKRKIQVDITRDSRFGLAQSTLIDKIKSESNYKENTMALDRFANQMDTNFFTYKWKVPDNLTKEVLGSIGNTELNSEQFAEHVRSNTRLRLQGSEQKDVKTTIRNLFNDFVSQKCLQFEESRLEDKYPDFKSLMREYREGILLFEATKNMVWDRASDDTTGLKLFYEKNKDKYRWDDRAVIHTVAIDTNDAKLAEKIYNYCKKNNIDKTISKFDKNKNFISFQKSTVEKKSTESYSGISFEKGATSELKKDEDHGSYSFRKVENVMSAGTKNLDEARGYIIADYQDYLEGLWIDELRSKYPVKVDEAVLAKLVKK